MKSQYKLLLYGKELVRFHPDKCTKMTSLTLQFTILVSRVMEAVLEPTYNGYMDYVVFGSTVKSAANSRGVSYLRCLAIGVERLEEGSHLFLAEGRYNSVPSKGFIGDEWVFLLNAYGTYYY